ncbi:MAG: glycosyltransferase family 8 protein [Lachnospiraceae bacterium]|nr:glycosyltransferase family 8 protein [Lachnospiraceae bacterium]
MNIVFVSNESYAPQLAASMCSVLYNNRSEEILDIYVISTGLAVKSIKSLNSLCSSYGRKLTVLDLNDISKRLDSESSAFSQKFDISIMGRFFLCELLPGDTDKVLYLDCDTITTASLHNLYDEIPDNDFIMAAVMEPTIYKTTKQMLKLNPDAPYFNSGVLLIDMNRWRDENGDQKMAAYFSEVAEASVFADQDVLNRILEKRVKFLSPKYNFSTNYYYFKRKYLTDISPSYSIVSEEEFEESKRSPVIIHYAGDEKPWIKGNHNPYKSEYEKYIGMTDWKDTPEQKGKEGFMLMYHAMNVATSVCPPVRKLISGIYEKKLYKK